ncbi:MAG: hypothetical protein GF364_13165 [Candidatus Lokiarchaeota archaeon]|nr:hypothetical protein [Candidatus Lokiarchaeota archaeon]
MDVVREIDLMLWVSSITFTSFLAYTVQYKIHRKRIEDEVVYKNIQTWIYFFICKAIGNTFGIINRLYLGETPNLKVLFDMISIGFDLSAITIKVNYLEKTLKLFERPYLTYFNIITIIITFITGEALKSNEVVMIIVFILQVVGFLFLPLMYLYMIFHSKGPIRRNAIFILAGLLILEIGLSIQAHNLTVIWPDLPATFQEITGISYLYTTPIEIMVGNFLIYKGFIDSF